MIAPQNVAYHFPSVYCEVEIVRIHGRSGKAQSQ
ncbi:hypothetical protein BKA03_000611 [Demequina lutea]|uniref:Uncharacterized protein n=1 Tax=Demequina lutea TaxID=431489 RepID=A0A7Y9Z7Y8_9MICO|nr:hypothetical protein [Demequina lutea]